MSLKVTKFDFEGSLPAKPVKVANFESEAEDLSNFSNFSYRGDLKNTLVSPSIQTIKNPERILTCSECDYFRPAVNSPNPTQAWGFCGKLDKGRYGAAMACEAILN